MTISIGGLISGLDTNGIIDQMLAIQQRPIERLQNKGSEYQIQLSTYGTLKGLVSSLQSAVSAIDTEGGLASYTATSGDKDLFTVTSGDDAAVGSYDVTVQQLAKVHKLTSTAFAAEEAMGEGTIHLKVGLPRQSISQFQSQIPMMRWHRPLTMRMQESRQRSCLMGLTIFNFVRRRNRGRQCHQSDGDRGGDGGRRSGKQ